MLIDFKPLQVAGWIALLVIGTMCLMSEAVPALHMEEPMELVPANEDLIPMEEADDLSSADSWLWYYKGGKDGKDGKWIKYKKWGHGDKDGKWYWKWH